MFLHPNYKSMGLFLACPLDSLEFDIEKIILELYNDLKLDPIETQIAKANEIIEPEPQSKIAALGFDDFKDVKKDFPLEQVQQSIMTDLKEYISIKITCDYGEPLEFWKNSNLLHLQKVAQLVFSKPASSAEPERHNSSAGLTMTELRNRLSQKNLESLVLYKCYLNENLI